MYRHQLPIPLKHTQTIHAVCSVWDKGYRYGFNTQEKDDDVFIGAYTAEYWEYDSRLGRRWNLDPIVKFYLCKLPQKQYALKLDKKPLIENFLKKI